MDREKDNFVKPDTHRPKSNSASNKRHGKTNNTLLQACEKTTQPPRPAKKPKNDKTAAYHAWPQYFQELNKVFKSLNTVYTFCCTRKHIAITFETIKASVENLTKKTLSIENLAEIRVLVPTMMSFMYTDKETMLKRVGSHQLDDPYELNSSKLSFDLLIEFLDGDPQKEVKNRNKRPEDASFAYNTASLAQVIEKRDLKFQTAVIKFLDECGKKKIDPVERISVLSRQYLPANPGEKNSVQCSEPNTTDRTQTTIDDLINELKNQPFYHDQIVPDGYRILDERPAEYGELTVPLSQEMRAALLQIKGISKFYVHQAQAINALNEGYNVIVSTSTSSGKSLVYQIPVLQALQTDSDARAMYVFPTKALAQDQKRALQELLSAIPCLQSTQIAAFDGDTPWEERASVRENAKIIFTNPDMLHVAILPHEIRWRSFFANLRYVVVDELHVYNGLFGSHIALVMRRLRRLCATFGNPNVQFVSCSATVANPEEHMKAIFGIDNVRLISVDGSPCGRKVHLVWNPALVDDGDKTQGRHGSITETAKLIEFLISRGVRTIAFCKVRKACEMLLKEVRDQLNSSNKFELASRVMSYRAGYTPQDRRRIEQQMFKGELLAIIATSALELGIDIGTLDAVITMGFPWTISALRQQSGRAGRRNKDSLSILVGDSHPLDQYYMRNPDELFTKPNANLNIDVENNLILGPHLQCAAHEMPIYPVLDCKYFGNGLEKLCRECLVEDEGFYHCHPKYRPYPSSHVNIRGIGDEVYVVIDITNNRNTLLEEIEVSRAIFSIYEGAIFFHQGITYLVKELNVDKKYATVVATNVDWHTRQRDYTDVDPIETHNTKHIGQSGNLAYYGSLRVSTTVFGYWKINRKNKPFEKVDLNMPPLVRKTCGLWIEVPPSAIELIRSMELGVEASVHAASHCLMSLLPKYVYSILGDVRTECKSPHATRPRPARIILYDVNGHGTGITRQAFQFIASLMNQALQTVESCSCEEGCPQCVTSPVCSEDNDLCSKKGALIILKAIVGKK